MATEKNKKKVDIRIKQPSPRIVEGGGRRKDFRQGTNKVVFVLAFLGFCLLLFLSVAIRMWTPPASPPTTEMPTPVIEKHKPSANDLSTAKSEEETALKEVSALPAKSPKLYGIYGALGCGLQNCGVYDKAEIYFNKAFDVGPYAYKTYPFDKFGDFNQNHINMLVDIGRLEDAAAFSDKLLQQETSALGASSKQAVQAGLAKARLLGYTGKIQDKQALSQKLIGILESSGRQKSGEWVEATTDLGESYQAQNQMHEAKECYQRALDMAKTLPDESLDIHNLEETMRHFATIK